MRRMLRSPFPALAALLLAAACSKPAAAPSPTAAEAAPAAPTNRIDVPPLVRQNLGIRFAKVERRRVAATLRLPGHFELLPQGTWQHHAPLAGRVVVRVQPLQAVQPGDVLYTLEAPEWRQLQRDLDALATEAQVLAAKLATIEPLLRAHEAHERGLADAAAVMAERLRVLEATRQEVGGQAQALADARVQLAQVRAQTAEAAEKHIETEALRRELTAQLAGNAARQQTLLATAAVLSGVPAAELAQPAEAPRWRTLGELPMRAAAAGVVSELPAQSGGWIAAGALVATVVDVAKVRCRAHVLQGDLPRLVPGSPARIVPPLGAPPGAAAASVLQGPLQLGAFAHPEQRSLDVYVVPEQGAPWARPGVAAFVEVETAGAAEPELAVPLAAVMPDGLDRVLFRRDPADPDRVIRLAADLGRDDGRWVEVLSGLQDGDEIVTAGAYALVLASAGAAQQGGHFHADGSWHADDHK